MPLVDYASSDEASENEVEVEEKNEMIKNEKNQPNLSVENTSHSYNVKKDGDGELFSSLPKPRKSFSFLDDDKKLSKLLLSKNSLLSDGRKSVKIAVPSVSEFENDTNQPAPKKIKPNAKSVGLFSILPPPKNNTVNQFTRNLVPQSAAKNQVKQIKNKSEAISADVNITVKGIDVDEDDDDDVPVITSFFGSSLVEQSFPSEVQYLSEKNVIRSETSNNFQNPGNSFVNEFPALPAPEQSSNLSIVINDSVGYSTNTSQTPEIIPASDNPLDLDEKALQILCGNKKKRQYMPMNVIDLSGEEIMPDSKEWLLKQFTEEKRGRGLGHKKTNGPSSQSRRKHQITYLAYQAKEQELELQNQWAQNRMSRKQTQSKYGF